MSETNYFKSDLRDIEFALFEQFNLRGLMESAPFNHITEEDVRLILKEAQTFASEVLGPTMQTSDREGCTLTPEGVKVPKVLHTAWKQYYENGWNTLTLAEKYGGQGAPGMLGVAVAEMLVAANVAFNMYPGLSMAAAAVIRAFGTTEQQERYAPKIEDGTWGGTMVLTEPHAGSDVGLSLTKASPLEDGTYSISGNKIFISGGDQDITENIIHLALARIEGAPKGTRGLSLFIIPKYRVNDDGSLGEPNDVVCTNVEHKMGIHASATAALAFGENGKCVGYLLGDAPGHGEHAGEGMRKMFLMMNSARIGVGIQSLGVASAAYLNALDYARNRQQGAHLTQGRPEHGAVPIIQHPDVRRMLLEMKAVVEGCRALIYHTMRLMDGARQMQDKEAADHERDYFDLFIPLVKGHISDMAVHVASLAVQVHGGAGYTQDYPVEQYLRDARIFPIYEGTNGIQALDLVGRKLGQHQGKLIGRYTKEYGQFLKRLSENADFAAEYGVLSKGLEQFNTVLGHFLTHALAGGDAMLKVAVNATGFMGAMGQLTIAKLLMESAMLATSAQAGAEGGQDAHYYQGKIAAARYYVRNFVPRATAVLATITTDDTTPLDIPDEGFSLAF